MTKIHKERDSDSIVDEHIPHLFDKILIFFNNPKSLNYEIRENELTSTEVHLLTDSTVFKDSDYEREGDRDMSNEFHLATYPSRDIEDIEKIIPLMVC